MKFLIKIICFVIYFFCVTTYATKIGVLDFNVVLQKSIQYQDFINKLNIKANDSYKKFNNNITDIFEEEKILQDKKELINTNKFTLLKDNLNNKKNKLLNDIKNIEMNLNNENLNMYNIIFSKMTNIVKNISKRKKYDFVLDKNNIIYYNNTIYDLTNDVVKKINLNK